MPEPLRRNRSEELLEALDALKRTEVRRHREPSRSPLFHALADEADAHRRRIFRLATEPDRVDPGQGERDRESPNDDAERADI